MHANRYRSIWYQIEPEDSDPALLLASLLMNLRAKLPQFTSPELAKILSAEAGSLVDLTRCANILLQDLDAYLEDDIYLVFDDLHRIEFGDLTNKLLEHLLDTSPPRVHFIFISRQPLTIKGTTIRNGSHIAYLSTADLALGSQDIEALYSHVLHKEISRQDAINIKKVTNGWIMGIILASHPISGKSKFWHKSSPRTALATPPSGHILDFFQEEIFSRIPENLQESFLQFSFLRDIPTELASEMSGIDNLGQIFTAMTRENFFIYHLDECQRVFHLHHFFKGFLQQRAKALFSTSTINKIYHQEARYYQKHHCIERALGCYKNCGNFRAMEEILRDKGLELLGQNKTFSLLRLLQNIPPHILSRHRWLSLYAGLLRIDISPETTLPFWDLARVQFARAKEDVGELIALSQTVYYHFVISGEYHKGAKLLPRTEALLAQNQSTLPIPILIMAAQNLASGYCFFMGEMDKARHYIQLATSLAERHQVRNILASTRLIQGYMELLSGSRAQYLREAEVCFALCSDPLVRQSNRLILQVMNLCSLSMTGDQYNFAVQQLALQKSVDQTLVDQTLAAPYLYVWASSNLFSLGQTHEALGLLAKGVEMSAIAATNHMHSQLLQWRAFGHALLGNFKEAEAEIIKAGQLREKAGGPFSTAINLIMAGAVSTRIQKFSQAGRYLAKGLAISQSIGSAYLTMCAHFHRSYCRLQATGPEAAVADLQAGLSLMRRNGYRHFWGWEPAMMTSLLALAVKKRIARSFAKNLAKTRLQSNLSDSGEPIPLLQIKLMDSFELRMAGKVLLQAKDLTPLQRELFGLLITARGQRIAQEKIQLELWPDSTPANARKSFDTLLNRLRKKLAPHMPRPVKEYISLQKGILSLTNYDIDALHFFKMARAGLAHSNNGEFLQAHNAFQTAISLWHGAMPEDTFRSERVLSFNDTLAGLLTKTGSTWAKNLAEAGRLDDAITILERILLRNSLDETLTILLYSFYCLNNNHLQAREILERYRKALVKAEYTAQQAASFIEQIIASTASD